MIDRNPRNLSRAADAAPPSAPGTLETDAVPVRAMRHDDLRAIVAIDRAAMGRPREEYYRARIAQALDSSTLETSLVAELDDHVVGFVLANLYYGEFGQVEPAAVLDSIGVHPEYRGRHVAQALMRQLAMNLRALGVRQVETLVDWDQLELLQFLAHHGFEPAPRLCLRLSLPEYGDAWSPETDDEDEGDTA